MIVVPDPGEIAVRAQESLASGSYSEYIPPVAFTYAFQPIVNVHAREISSYEALIRGPVQESAWQILQRVPPDQKYQFDRLSRAAAICQAGRLGIDCQLNLNFLPRSIVGSDEFIVGMLANARLANIDAQQIVLEISESEMITDLRTFSAELNECRKLGMYTSIDDFGAGYSGLNLLADFQPDQVKIDIKLVRGVQSDGPRQAIVRAVLQVCVDLGIDVVAEGVESREEFHWLYDQGIELFQGYLFARPGFECLPDVTYPG